ncbi:MAG: hypothetical protein AAB483_02565 [Patescibacteria group bacterium]
MSRESAELQSRKEIIFVDAEVVAPDEFLNDPFGYFEREGKNTRPGDKVRYVEGIVARNHRAVRDLPDWKLKDTDIPVRVVGKKVNLQRHQIGETQNPLHEFEIMTHIQEHHLPCARPLARIEKDGQHLLVMERLEGERLFVEKEGVADEAKQNLIRHGFSLQDIDEIVTQATMEMAELSLKFEEEGIIRPWHLKDMIVKIDFEHKKVISVTPVDWERTLIKKKE